MEIHDDAKYLNSKVKRVDSLWDDRGDMVICAGTEKARVYEDMLNAKSNLFSDLLGGLGQAPLINHSQRGVLVTDKTKDMPFRTIYFARFDDKDVFSFLSEIVNPPERHLPVKAVEILRLADKYDAPDLLQTALSHLVDLLPLNQQALEWILERESDYRFPDDTMIQTYLTNLLPLVNRIPDTKWFIPSIVYLIINLIPLSNLMKYEYFVRTEREFRIMIIQCGINLVMEQRESISSCRGIIPALEACANDSVEIGTPLWNYQKFEQEHMKQPRGDFWNKHVELCGFETLDKAKEMRDRLRKGRNL